MKTVTSFAAGAAAALALVLSCSDDNSSDADAAEPCEPPLTGRINRIENVRTNVADPFVGTGALCPAGHILLGGGCEVEGQNSESLVLNLAGSDSELGGYSCNWQNPQSITVETVRAWAVCLTPAP